MSVLIYGAGSVGLGLASCLLKAGAELDFVDKEEITSSLREHGLQRTGIFGDFHVDPDAFQSCALLRSLPHRQYDYILLRIENPRAEHVVRV
jgi:2-dehydropantoate 2-reductase